MVWKYILVFLGAFLFDVVPFPFPPAFTIMLTLQIIFGLNLWIVLFVGVAGSIFGRYILSLYIGKLSGRFFKKTANEDVEFLGKKMKQDGWKAQAVILAYSLLPLPTTPLFVAAGIAKVPPVFIIPAFFIGKLTSDMIALSMGKYAAENLHSILDSLTSFKSIAGLILSLVLLVAIFLVDWRKLLQEHKFGFKYKVLKK
jgi:uncharacterized membrane protein YdjX (TVP38/TMEM64 family)